MNNEIWRLTILITLSIVSLCVPLGIAKEYADTIENFRNMRALAKLIKVRDGDTFVITMATARRGERTLPMYSAKR